METINFDDFDTSAPLFAKVTEVVTTKLETVKALAEYDPDFGVVIPELEALLATLVPMELALNALAVAAKVGEIPVTDYLRFGGAIIRPLEIIIEGHNERQRRLAGKTDS